MMRRERRWGCPRHDDIRRVHILAWQPLQCAIAYAERAEAFPTLADGEARPGDAASLHLRFDRASYPAFDLFEPSPDWRGYSVPALDVTNPGAAPLWFTRRIHDMHHDWSNEDRLNLPVDIPAGARTTVRISVAATEAAPAQSPASGSSELRGWARHVICL